jgi:hypothetical protein
MGVKMISHFHIWIASLKHALQFVEGQICVCVISQKVFDLACERFNNLVVTARPSPRPYTHNIGRARKHTRYSSHLNNTQNNIRTGSD